MGLWCDIHGDIQIHSRLVNKHNAISHDVIIPTSVVVY